MTVQEIIAYHGKRIRIEENDREHFITGHDNAYTAGRHELEAYDDRIQFHKDVIKFLGAL